ncbi:MAG: hypothetical protein ACK500_02125 [Flavobacteriales bacterium]
MKIRTLFFVIAVMCSLVCTSCRRHKQSCAAYDKMPVEQVK